MKEVVMIVAGPNVGSMELARMLTREMDVEIMTEPRPRIEPVFSNTSARLMALSAFSGGCFGSFDLAMQMIEIRREYAAFVRSLGWVREVVRFLATAINVLKRGRIIFQPRWRAGRWKAKT